MSAKPKQLFGVQCARGIAACLVVLYHAGRMLTLPQYVGHSFLFSSLFRFGNAGVDFFFVLSGFIIAYVHSRDLGDRSELPHYLWQRITRIYPIYWVVTLLIIALLVAKHDWNSLQLPRVVQSLLLLPGPEDPLLGVAWTLIHEVAFYVVFAIAIYSRPIGILFASLALVAAMIDFHSHSLLIGFFHTPYHLEFAFGVLAAAVASKNTPAVGWGFIGLGLCAFSTSAWWVDAGILDDENNLARLCFSIASTFLIIGLACVELKTSIQFPLWCRYIGAASYSIYLIHTIIIGWSARLLFALPVMQIWPATAALASFLAALCIGCALHTWVEFPLQRAIRTWVVIPKSRTVI